MSEPRPPDYCPHCNGYGSSLKDPEGVDQCTVCGGTGLKTEVPFEGRGAKIAVENYGEALERLGEE